MQAFFDHVREQLFHGALRSGQVDGMQRVLDYRASRYPAVTDAQLAYVLATIKHETADRMQPVTEYGSQKYLRSKKYWPWIGRGLVQITWAVNYRKFGIETAERALDWDVALDVTFRGMINGMFTGKRLDDYIAAGKADYVGARRIINGTDKARLVAAYARDFARALALALEQKPNPKGDADV